ncbi:hypothetical protein WDU94_007490 [Cyamophila willieti]
MKFTLFFVASALVLAAFVVDQSSAALPPPSDTDKFELAPVDVINAIEKAVYIVYNQIPLPPVIMAILKPLLKPEIVKQLKGIGASVAKDAMVFVSSVKK